MRGLIAAAMAATMLPAAVSASEIGDQLARHLYDGTLAETTEASFALCNDEGTADACFAAGLIDLIGAVEGLSQALYRHGATTPGTPAAAMLLGMGIEDTPVPANPNPEPLSYDQLRTILGDFVQKMDYARMSFEIARMNLRRFSDCFVYSDCSSRRVSLVTPSTRVAISSPNFEAISSRVAGVSSIVSCSSAVAMAAASSL